MQAQYRELIVWKKSMSLCEGVYRLTEDFPDSQRFSLTQQIQRSSVSIPSNIAEGNGRENRADYRHFLVMARGSANEVETQLVLAQNLGFVTEERITILLELIQEIQKILTTLISKLTNNKTH